MLVMADNVGNGRCHNFALSLKSKLFISFALMKDRRKNPVLKITAINKL
jgi:hypothetical protein